MTLTKEVKITLSFVLLVTALRVVYLSLTPFNLFFDEAQYWYWAQNFDWGYFSKPPMVAWLIAATTSVCGDGEACVRLASPLLHAVTSFIIFFTADELFKDKKISLYSALAYLTLPAVSVSSALISTDPPLLLFWALALLFFVKAIKQDNFKYWLFAGIAAGFGMMSKYNMLLFLASVMLYLAVSQDQRKHFKSKGFWAACVVAAVIFLPNIIWNIQNGLASFLHTKENASGSGISLHLDHMLEFLGAQFGVFGPIFFAALLVIIFQAVKTCKISEEFKLLLCFILPLLLVITTISLLSRAHANWAAPIYVPATMLVVAWLIQTSREKLINISFAIHIFAALLLTNFHLIDNIPGVSFTGSKTKLSEGKIKDPFKRVHGWSELGEGVAILLTAYPDAKILTDSRKIHSELMYYVRPYAFDAVKWNPAGKRGDHFELTTDINKAGVRNFIYITKATNIDHLANNFESAERVGNIEVKPYDDYAINYYAYYLVGFKGYDAQGI